eukprot:CAMPEP_0116892176 /NCGR_PEP_ID=MMETSP0467-20121206/2457_1 /TAXON_ID=283647 /ORGANISM="Mesodinium pulex, Strain SPMC105" /LENGTH=130 /DNA_ID=CAMNT_0004561159 /DNA_START=411 /DNA_END=803 /DNA_ORIENTATION=-
MTIETLSALNPLLNKPDFLINNLYCFKPATAHSSSVSDSIAQSDSTVYSEVQNKPEHEQQANSSDADPDANANADSDFIDNSNSTTNTKIQYNYDFDTHSWTAESFNRTIRTEIDQFEFDTESILPFTVE